MAQPRMGAQRSVQLLLSGGIDSTACLDFLLDSGFSVACTFVDFGQPARASELAAVREVTSHYSVPLNVVEVAGLRTVDSGELIGRNGFLLFTCLVNCEHLPSAISIGVHAGTAYADCCRQFVETLDGVFAELTEGRTRVFAPFVDWDKNKVVNYARARAVPLEKTFSCESAATPCGKCSSCIDREILQC
jgi:7-cyano-7-deazaguanine synthase